MTPLKYVCVFLCMFWIPLEDLISCVLVCQTAVVTLRGTLNGIPFSISRTKTLTKSGLTFLYDGVDLTTQSPKETQELMYSRLGISPEVLSRTTFHGQHSLNELLEATDTKLKDELSLVVNLSVWQSAVALARKKAREAAKRVSEYDGMLALRSLDIASLQKRLTDAEVEASRIGETTERTILGLQAEIDLLTASDNAKEDFLQVRDLENEANLGVGSILAAEAERAEVVSQRNVDLTELEIELDTAQTNLASFDSELRAAEQAHDAIALRHNVAQDRVAQFESLWNVSVHSTVDEILLTLPDSCPTCRQPFPGVGDGMGREATSHDHQDQSMATTVHKDAEALRSLLNHVQEELGRSTDNVRIAREAHQGATNKLAVIRRRRDDASQIWQDRMDEIDARLHAARMSQQSLAAQFAVTAKQLETESRLQSLKTRMAAERDRNDAALRAVKRISAELWECQELVSRIEADKLSQSDIVRVMGDLTDAFGSRGIQTFALQGAVSTLESLTSALLNELSEGTQQLQLSLDAGDRIARRAFVRGDSLKDGGAFKERPLASLSGGQWRRCSLALTLAFSELVASRTNFQPSVIVLDEPLTHLDQTGRASVGRVLRSLLRRTSEQLNPTDSGRVLSSMKVSTILLILQDLAAVELEESFDCIDDVVKENGFSTVLLDDS
jgi:DNA repair exonuclease SbcCD ATPase subunit